MIYYCRWSIRWFKTLYDVKMKKKQHELGLNMTSPAIFMEMGKSSLVVTSKWLQPWENLDVHE